MDAGGTYHFHVVHSLLELLSHPEQFEDGGLVRAGLVLQIAGRLHQLSKTCTHRCRDLRTL